MVMKKMAITQKQNSYKNKFSAEEKKAYQEGKNKEKKELFNLYKCFFEKKTIQEIVGIVANYKQIYKSYSLRNIIMMHIQSEERNDKDFQGIVNSFQNWKKQKISILKGSKAYKVLVPIFKKVEVEEEDETIEKQELRGFRLGNVFDISQTTEFENYQKEQQKIDEVIMNNIEIDYDIALNFVKENFKELKINENIKELDVNEEKGYYEPLEKSINIHQKSSHTVFHELAHHISFKLNFNFDNWQHDRTAYAKNEILAELGCYLLMGNYTNCTNYNFNYSNVWSSRILDNFEYDEFERIYNKLSKFINNFF